MTQLLPEPLKVEETQALPEAQEALALPEALLQLEAVEQGEPEPLLLMVEEAQLEGDRLPDLLRELVLHWLGLGLLLLLLPRAKEALEELLTVLLTLGQPDRVMEADTEAE